ncbi:MAG: DUF4179 domain-containing protein [Cellulosilyticaceae bacterium]
MKNDKRIERREEYEALLEALEDTPIELDYTMQRVEARLNQRKKRRFWAIPASSMLMLCTVFVLLVNTVPTFAYTCGQIPVLKELAKAVAFSPSLSAAVENQYVQPINIEQQANGVTAKIEYLIVDQKQVNIFYSLKSDEWDKLNIRPQISALDGTELQGYGLRSGGYEKADGTLYSVVVDFIEEKMPESIQLTLNVLGRNEYSMWEEDLATIPTKVSEEVKPKGETELGAFVFDLRFDPYYTAQGEQMVLEQPFMLDGQQLILEEVGIYPTHMNIRLDDVASNTAWLKSLKFYIVNEKGEHFDKVANGISASGKVDSPMMEDHRLESAFFSKSKELTMYITAVEWLDKDRTRTKLDLTNVEAEWLAEGVSFESAERIGSDWMLTFHASYYEEGHHYQLWDHNFYDEYDKEYEINSYSTSSMSDYNKEQKKVVDRVDVFEVRIPLVDYPYDTVYLSPLFTRRVEMSETVVIKIK